MRSRTVRALAAAGVLALVGGACGASSSKPSATGSPSTTSTSTSTPASPSTTATATTFTPKPVSWHACTASEGPTGRAFQCATLMVPLDPTKPGKAMIALALARHLATGTDKGALIYNPGGPGESAIDELSGLVSEFGQDLRTNFDVVAFDPPGVGHSDPITCASDAGLARYFHEDPAPPGPNALNLVVSESKQFADGCEQRSGKLLPDVSTVDAATDMEYVREALGRGKLNYLGFSYGTFLGDTYAQLFGRNVRTMVLDGDENPDESSFDLSMAQASSVEQEFDLFASQCEANPSCAWHQGGGTGGNLVTAFQQLLARVRQTPIPVGSRSVGPAELLTGTLQALYSTALWPDTYEALADAEIGDGAGILALDDLYNGRNANGTYSNALEAEGAVNCLDDPSPSPATVAAALPQFEKAAPVYGAYIDYGNIGCDVWPVPPTGRPHVITAPQAPTILVVGSTGDPVTPYANSKALVAQLAHSELLTRDGSGHTAYLSSACIQQHVDAYLEDVTLPPQGTVCSSAGGQQ